MNEPAVPLTHAFVTGGNTFVGQALIRLLVARDVAVTALVAAEDAALLGALGATVVSGTLDDPPPLAQHLQGQDVLFHLAELQPRGRRDAAQAHAVHVEGARYTLRAAMAAGVSRIIYGSSLAVLGGQKRGFVPDETYEFYGPFDRVYDRTKWEAHYQVVLPLLERGAPIVIVMPGLVYGPGDTGFVTELMRLFLRGRLVALAGPRTTFCWSHVEDIARGYLLAAERGAVGESYILAGPAVPIDEMVDFWSNLSRQNAPHAVVPPGVLRRFGPLFELIPGGRRPNVLFTGDMVRAADRQYVGRSDKARAELGWTERSLQSGMLETLRWVEAQLPPPRSNAQRALAGAGLAGALLALWLTINRRS